VTLAIALAGIGLVLLIISEAKTPVPDYGSNIPVNRWTAVAALSMALLLAAFIAVACA
jgi:hypothetical protein